jgi:hypothetical protein
MVVAVVALTFALAGTAIAGPDAITSAVTKSKVKKIAKQQANKQIKKKAGGLSVANAQNAVNATTAANGAVGHGEFTPTGAVRPGAFNMNNLTVSTLGTFIYCEDQAFKSVTATGGITTGGAAAQASAISRQALADLGATPATVGCPANTEWVYATFDPNGTGEPGGFQAVGY